MFIARIECGEFGYNFRVVDDHGKSHWDGKILRRGRICLAMAPLTV
jgi:hypothetical protein